MFRILCLIATLILIAPGVASAAPEIEDPDLRASVERLSASTLVGGEGWVAYERLLHPQYSRWAMGGAYEGRDAFVGSLKGWWEYGMRVAERTIEMIGVDMVGDLAILRFKTTESFLAPDGTQSEFTGYVSNVWIKEEGAWLLLSAEVITGS